MNIEEANKILGGQENLAKTLGMVFLNTPDEDSCSAQVKVTPQVSQPFGYMNGGTSLAIAENLAGVGSTALCPNKFPMGLNVTANHMTAVPVGQTITAKATILHKGDTTHVWNVDIFREDGKLAFTARVTNFMITPENWKEK